MSPVHKLHIQIRRIYFFPWIEIKVYYLCVWSCKAKWDKLTFFKKKVTCKNCLKLIER